jgi:glycosyltransferase involved in cell wall biosynthesis
MNTSLIKIVEEYDPNALLIFGWKHHSHLRVMRYFHSKIPIIFRGDSTILDDGKYFLSTFIRYQVLKFVYKKIDLVLSPGKASDLYFKKSGLNSSQIIRAEHAVDVTRFAHLNQNEQSQLASLISGLKISHDETVFVFAGKFIKKKNPILLIEAFLHVLKQGFNVRLLLVGNGIMRDSIKKRLSALPDNKLCKINLLPFQDQNQMKLIYRLASVFVLPSSGPHETWGLSINEALASKTPVIVSDKCGCAYDLVLDGINGHVFRSDDVNDLVSKMIKFCDSKYLQTLVDNIDNTIAKYTFQSFKLALDKIM